MTETLATMLAGEACAGASDAVEPEVGRRSGRSLVPGRVVRRSDHRRRPPRSHHALPDPRGADSSVTLCALTVSVQPAACYSLRRWPNSKTIRLGASPRRLALRGTLPDDAIGFGQARIRRRPALAAVAERGCTMANDPNEISAPKFATRLINRRRARGRHGGGRGGTQVRKRLFPSSGRRRRRGARCAPRATRPRLIGLDNLPGQNWLYYDPARLYEINPASGFQVVYECLYHIPDGYEIGDIEPLLAEDMPAVSDDGLTVTIPIKSGVTFHNTGNEMTADDWVWSWNRLKNLLGNPSFLVTDFMESFSAVDPTTIEIKLLSPNAALAAILTSLPFAVSDSTVAQEHGGVAEEGADRVGHPHRLAEPGQLDRHWSLPARPVGHRQRDHPGAVRGLLGRRRGVRPHHFPQRRRLQHPAPASGDRRGRLRLLRRSRPGPAGPRQSRSATSGRSVAGIRVPGPATRQKRSADRSPARKRDRPSPTPSTTTASSTAWSAAALSARRPSCPLVFSARKRCSPRRTRPTSPAPTSSGKPAAMARPS